MSDLAIAAVTATLRSILHSKVNTNVTTLPPDKAATSAQANRLNLFLYYMSPNAAWRNQTIPTKVKRGETGQPPLALNLYYLLTAYGDDEASEADHRLLGTAMRVLHDNAVLTAKDIRDATGESPLKDAALERQFEQVKITPEPLTLEEMSKLWTTFQTQYRISAAFQTSVVLIESQRGVTAPLPVLKRGEADRGVDVVPSLPGLLEGVEYRDLRARLPAFPAAQLGEVITLQGRNLPGTRCQVLFIDPNRQPTDAEPEADIIARLSPEGGSNSSAIYVRLDPSLPHWSSGPLQVLLEDLPQPGAKRPARSNALRFGLAPSLLVNGNMPSFVTIENNRRQLILNCHPPISQTKDPAGLGADVWPEISLLLSPLTGKSQVAPQPLNQQSPNLSVTRPVFDVQDVPAGRYRVRLRIETVESLVMQREGALLEFDERQVVQL